MRLVTSAAFLLALFNPALAGDVRSACMQDIKTLCAGVTPGGGAIRECMREHREQVSEPCKVAIADRMLSRQPHSDSQPAEKPAAGN